MGALIAASNYADTLLNLERFAEAKALIRKAIPVARRVLGEGDEITLRMRWNYATALYEDAGATLDDVREAVATLEELARTARRVFGETHPDAVAIKVALGNALAALSARKVCEAMAAMTPSDAQDDPSS